MRIARQHRARRSSRSTRDRTRARAWWRATSSTPPRACSPRRRSTASSSARRPSGRLAQSSPTEAPSPSTAKGKSEPVPVWEAVEARARFGVEQRRQARAARRPRPRARPRSLGALERARTRREPQLVTLVGVPGIGKSRLVAELFRAIDADPELIRWRRGRSLPYGEVDPALRRFAEMVKAHAGILDTRQRRGGRGEAARGRPRCSARTPRAGPSGCGRSSASAASTIGGGRRAGQSFAAWRRLVEAIAEQGPLVLVFDDLHWADDDLLDFVDHLVDWVADVPLLVVCTARPGAARAPAGLGRRQAERADDLALAARRRGHGASSSATLLGRARAPGRRRSRRCSRAPAATRSTPSSSRDALPRARRRPALPLPETVQGIIAARLDGLPPEEKRAAAGRRGRRPAVLARTRSRSAAEPTGG